MNTSDNYYDIYMYHIFSTLGQLTAMTITSAVVVPLYSFYSGSSWSNWWSAWLAKSAVTVKRLNEFSALEATDDTEIEGVSFYEGTRIGDNDTTNPIMTFDNCEGTSFIMNLNVSIKNTTNSGLFALYTLEGVKLANTWILQHKYVGDLTGIDFKMTENGDLVCVSPHTINWASTTFKFFVNTINSNEDETETEDYDTYSNSSVEKVD